MRRKSSTGYEALFITGLFVLAAFGVGLAVWAVVGDHSVQPDPFVRHP
jgi:hypothetical protein